MEYICKDKDQEMAGVLCGLAAAQPGTSSASGEV